MPGRSISLDERWVVYDLGEHGERVYLRIKAHGGFTFTTDRRFATKYSLKEAESHAKYLGWTMEGVPV